MTTITMSQTITHNGRTLTSGQTYSLRSREAKVIVNAGQATKAKNKGH